jgi:hypothetical protein
VSPATGAEEKVTALLPELPTAAVFDWMYVIPPLPRKVKLTPLLAEPPTVTTTLPLVAPAGTGTVMLVALQLVGVAEAPLKVTVLVPCDDPKFDPEMVTAVPATAAVVDKLLIVGEELPVLSAAMTIAQ